MNQASVRRWPLFLIAAPAAVAIWSGWVGLGALCGFGIVHPLPGIVPGFRLNTAVTLPVGVEAYGAYALGAWLNLGAGHPARSFAKRSAIGSLALGMLGQVAFHLLAAAHAIRAPWPVVVLVSCLPVVTLGFGAALTHLLRAVPEPDTQAGGAPETVPDALATAAPATFGSGHDSAETAAPADSVPAGVPGARSVPVDLAALNGHARQAVELFADDLAGGTVPGIRAIRSGLSVGQDKATQVQAYLRSQVRTPTDAAGFSDDN